MATILKTCILCAQQFELLPDKAGFANRCPRCSAPEAAQPSVSPASNARGTNPLLRRKVRNLSDHKDAYLA